jgi:hypothetical protein
MSNFKVISIQGSKAFITKQFSLLVHKRAVAEILDLLAEGHKLVTTSNHNYIEHCFFTFQSSPFGDEKQILKRLVYYPEELEWVNWLYKITPRIYSTRLCSIEELVDIFQDIEVIKFNYEEGATN